MAKKSKGSKWKADSSHKSAYRKPERADVYKLSPDMDYSNSKRLNEEYEQYRAQKAGYASEPVKKKKATEKKSKKSSYRSPNSGAVSRKAKKHTAKNRKKQKKKNTFLSYTVLAVVLVTALCAGIFVFFKVGEIKVTGNKKYTAAEIINASGIELGDNLYACSSGKAQRLITGNKPYVKSVQFKHSLPDLLIIEVTESKAAYAFAKAGKYTLCDDSLKVLEITNKVPAGAAVVSGVGIEQTPVGKIALFDKESKGELVKTVQSELYKAGIKKLSAIDVKNDVEIKAVYDGRIEILIGQIGSISYKAELAGKAIEDLDKDNNKEKGTINVKQASETKQAYYKPKV